MSVSRKKVKAEYARLSGILNSKKFLIWDSVREELVTEIELLGFEDEFGLRINHVVIYSSDLSIDNGYFDTEEEFLEKTSHYKSIPFPENPELLEIIQKLA